MSTLLRSILRSMAGRRRAQPLPVTSKISIGHAGWVAIETVVVNFAALLLRYWVAPDDLFGLDAQFPWLWIVPALLAMVYGTAVGVSSVTLLVGAWLALQLMAGSSDLLAGFPSAYFLGGLALTLLAGQFADVWNARTRRLKAVNAYLEERLATLTRNHFLLRLSHERLEQDLLAKPLTLRETLVHLRQLSGTVDDHNRHTLPAATEFMQLLAQSCQLEVAGIFALHEGRPQPSAVAVLGECDDLVLDDPLLHYCLVQDELVHVQSTAAPVDARDTSRYLICAPVKPSGSATLAVVAVERMPFFALNEDNLQLLSVLAGYYADGLQLQDVAGDVLARLPDCPPEMALDIVRLHRIRAQAGIESSLVALVFETNAAAGDIFEQVKLFKRGVDLAWEISTAERRILITLLPLAGRAAVDGYLLRIDGALRAQFGAGLTESHVATHIARIGEQPPVETLVDLVRRCGHA